MKLKPRFMAAALAVTSSLMALPLSSMPQKASGADFSVFINEVCTQNKSCLADSYGVYSDWIELYNAGSSPADLSGYGLSDKAGEPLQWVFPEGTTIGAGEYMIVFASKQASTASELHTGFALSKNGETLVLSNPQGSILREVTIPTVPEDSSYGCTPDGSDTYEIMTATPKQSNAVVVSAPAFSAESGFYGSDFQLTLSAENGETIYYTTDGSDPTTSSTAKVYSGAITVYDRTDEANIYSAYAEDESSATSVCLGIGYQEPPYNVDKSMVVRAASKNSDGQFSAVADKTYFVTDGNLSQYKDYTVVSLVTNPDNLFDPDTGIYVTGNQYLDWKNSSDYDPNKSVWDYTYITNYYSRGREWEREASVTFFENGETVASQNMGIRIKGASTRNHAQKSFNLYARSDYGESKLEYPIIPGNIGDDGSVIGKYDSISLRSVNDEVRLRDGFAQKLLADRDNITTQDMKSCVVFLNGEYWGTYEITEKLSDYFIESNYGIQKQDVAMIKNGSLEEGTQEEFDSFMNFADTYSTMNLTNEANYKAVCDFIDIDSLIEHYAAGLYLGTYDWPNYNYGVWRSTGAAIDGNQYSDGKWRFISFDYDYTMGATYADFGGVEGYAYDSFNHMQNVDGAGQYAPTNLFINLLNNSEFRTKFAGVYCDYANEVLTPEKANAMADIYSRDYTELAAGTLVRWWGYFGGTKEGNLSYHRGLYQNTTLKNIRTFFAQRASYTLEDMKNYLGLGGSLNTITLKTNGNGSIRINSIIPDTADGGWSGKYYSDCPVTLTAIPADGAQFTGWGGDISGSDTTVTVTLSQAMEITADFGDKPVVEGDVNADGEFGVADVVAVNYFLTKRDADTAEHAIADWHAGDLDGSSTLDVFDLAIMRKKLAE